MSIHHRMRMLLLQKKIDVIFSEILHLFLCGNLVSSFFTNLRRLISGLDGHLTCYVHLNSMVWGTNDVCLRFDIVSQGFSFSMWKQCVANWQDVFYKRHDYRKGGFFFDILIWASLYPSQENVCDDSFLNLERAIDKMSLIERSFTLFLLSDQYDLYIHISLVVMQHNCELVK